MQAAGPKRFAGDHWALPSHGLHTLQDAHQQPAAAHTGDDGVRLSRHLPLQLLHQGRVTFPGGRLVEGMHVCALLLLHHHARSAVRLIPHVPMHQHLGPIEGQALLHRLRRGAGQHHRAGQCEAARGIGRREPRVAAAGGHDALGPRLRRLLHRLTDATQLEGPRGLKKVQLQVDLLSCFLGKTIFSGAATKKGGKKGATEQLSLCPQMLGERLRVDQGRLHMRQSGDRSSSGNVASTLQKEAHGAGRFCYGGKTMKLTNAMSPLDCRNKGWLSAGTLYTTASKSGNFITSNLTQAFAPQGFGFRPEP